MNADRRLLPFLFVLSLAALRVGRRGRKLAVIAILVFALRAASLEQHFLSLQPHLEGMAESFSVIPKGARVLPVVPWAQGQPIVERHFWAYGVIERGWFSPCLFHDPGVQPFQLKLQTYNPYQPSSCGDLKSVDWVRVRSDYQYAWAYNVPQYAGALAAISTAVFEDDDLRVYRLKRSPGAPGSAGITPDARLDTARSRQRWFPFRRRVAPPATGPAPTALTDLVRAPSRPPGSRD